MLAGAFPVVCHANRKQIGTCHSAAPLSVGNASPHALIKPGNKNTSTQTAPSVLLFESRSIIIGYITYNPALLDVYLWLYSDYRHIACMIMTSSSHPADLKPREYDVMASYKQSFQVSRFGGRCPDFWYSNDNLPIGNENFPIYYKRL